MKEWVRVRWPCTRVRVFSSTSMDKEVMIRLSLVGTPGGAYDDK